MLSARKIFLTNPIVNNIKPVIDFYKQSNLLKFINGEAGISEINIEKRKISLSIKLLEEMQNKEAVSKFSSPLSGKNLPFSSLSEKLDKTKKDDK